jgi:uncharacterized protein (TIGR02217 family)
MAAFHEVQFPPDISKGSSGGPSRLTDIVELISGFEERNATQAHSKRTYDAGLGLRHLDDLADVIAFWEARFGELYGFRWKDWTDFKSCKPGNIPGFADQAIGVGTGAQTTFQIYKTYISGAYTYIRPIRKPVSGSVRVGINGVQQLSGWSVDTTTGILTFSVAPGYGLVVTAGYEFDVPVRFAANKLTISVDAFNHGGIPQIDIKEIRV